MDQIRFNLVTQILTNAPSRRDVLRGLVSAGIGVGSLRLAADTEAGKKSKRKKKNGKKKPKALVFNQYGCVDVGQACRGDSSNCCSGICEGVVPRKGKQDRSRCAPHNTGVCTPETNSCDVGVDVPCGPSNIRGVCAATTGKAAFCADISAGTTTHCRVCSKDTDCQGEFGAGAACVVLGGACTPLCIATGRTACIPPGA